MAGPGRVSVTVHAPSAGLGLLAVLCAAAGMSRGCWLGVDVGVWAGGGQRWCSSGWGGMGTPGTALCREHLSLLSLPACAPEEQLPGKQSFPSYLASVGKHTEIMDVISRGTWALCLCCARLGAVLFCYQQIRVTKLLGAVWSLLKVFFPRVILLLCCIQFSSTSYYQTAKLLLLMQQRTMGSLQPCSQNTLLAFFMPGFPWWKK